MAAALALVRGRLARRKAVDRGVLDGFRRTILLAGELIPVVNGGAR